MAKRPASGSKKSRTIHTLSQERLDTWERLVRLRNQFGTKGLAERMGIPAASLRRMLGKGKSAGLPKSWEGIRKTHVQITIARQPEAAHARRKLHRRIKRVIDHDTLDSEYEDIADEFGLETNEVYTMGMSPAKFGINVI